MADNPNIRKKILFHGRVQGVGFRYMAMHYASSLGLTGWVKNESNGSVSMEVQGRASGIERLLEALSLRPYVSIEWMDAEEIPLVEEERRFRIR